MYQGRMQIILRSTKTPSNVKLEISSADLKEKLSLKTSLK